MKDGIINKIKTTVYLPVGVMYVFLLLKFLLLSEMWSVNKCAKWRKNIILKSKWLTAFRRWPLISVKFLQENHRGGSESGWIRKVTVRAGLTVYFCYWIGRSTDFNENFFSHTSLPYRSVFLLIISFVFSSVWLISHII
jgi:hypothetical protein